VSFTLAHLSDAHLAHMRKRLVLRNFSTKRIIGGVSWFMKRRHVHSLAVADAIQASIIAAKPDHVALTGDLVNIAAWNEFPAAAGWVARFGPPERLTIVPGNHDAYVPVPWNEGLSHLMPWMQADRQDSEAGAAQFPFVRLRRNVAVIGVNSGQPQTYHRAAGTVGARQLRDLAHILTTLGQQGFCRIVLIHHPPLPGLAIARKALTDSSAMQDTLAKAGCELVLHGHNHRSMLNWFSTASGATPVIGVPSASIAGDHKHEAAGWNSYGIRRMQGLWQIDLTPHRWNRDTSTVETQATVKLSPPAAGTEVA
jgi:3',5'-cyclic AMP phosphodiesterase CpdA